MSTVLDGILDKFKAAASSIVSADAVEIEPVGDPTIFPAFEIYDGGDVVLELEAGVTRRALTVTVEGYVERGDGTEATAERNELHADLVRAVMADETQGGTVESVEAGDRRTGAATLAEHRRLMFGQDFTVVYTTNRYDPALPA